MENYMNLYALFGSSPASGVNALLGIFDTQNGAIQASASIPKGTYAQYYVSPYVLNELKPLYAHEQLHYFTPEGH